MKLEGRLLGTYWSICQRAMDATSLEMLEQEIGRFAALFGFHNYGFASKGAGLAESYHYATNFGPAWTAQYKSLNTPEVERQDLRIIQAKNWHPPAGWNSLGQNSYTPPPQLQKALRARLILTGEFGIHSGITVPMRARGIDWAFLSLTLNHRNHPREFDQALFIATYFTHCLQTALSRINSNTAGTVSLSGREEETLRWAAIGKTSWEISQILGISESTANYHLSRAATKLGVKGRRAAVAQALAQGLIRL